jgi:hypothetical protein
MVLLVPQLNDFMISKLLLNLRSLTVSSIPVAKYVVYLFPWTHHWCQIEYIDWYLNEVDVFESVMAPSLPLWFNFRWFQRQIQVNCTTKDFPSGMFSLSIQCFTASFSTEVHVGIGFGAVKQVLPLYLYTWVRLILRFRSGILFFSK